VTVVGCIERKQPGLIAAYKVAVFFRRLICADTEQAPEALKAEALQ